MNENFTIEELKALFADVLKKDVADLRREIAELKNVSHPEDSEVDLSETNNRLKMKGLLK